MTTLVWPVLNKLNHYKVARIFARSRLSRRNFAWPSQAHAKSHDNKNSPATPKNTSRNIEQKQLKPSERDIAEKALINYDIEMPACSVVFF